MMMADRTAGSVASLQAKIARLETEVERLSVDAVTGVAGRGVLDRALTVEFAKARRADRSLGIVMIDIDHFKSVNDTYGHQIGDRTLRMVAQTIDELARESDIFARYGGEEFMLIVDDTSPSGLAIAAERIRVAVDSARHAGGAVAVTVSIGTSWLAGSDASIDSVVRRADAALYQAKRAGRNRVVSG